LRALLIRYRLTFAEGKANFDTLIAMGDLNEPPPLAGFIDRSFLAESL